MVQQTGETRDAIIEDDNKRIAEIIHANRHRKDPYWIVLFAKPSRNTVDGKPTLVKHIKAYGTKPIQQVGAVYGEVDNVKGTVKWDVNMPQKPFDFDKLQQFGAKPCEEVIVETTSIAGAYLTQ